jgi:hypothetical protein
MFQPAKHVSRYGSFFLKIRVATKTRRQAINERARSSVSKKVSADPFRKRLRMMVM